MIANYIVTVFAIVGLFVNPKRPSLSFFVWTGTNLWWTFYSYRVSDWPQFAMFTAFTIACAIQFLRTP